MAGRIVQGICASPGSAAGTLFLPQIKPSHWVPTGDPAREAAFLRQAIQAALQELAALEATVSGDARDMLALQSALLGDDALAEPVFAAIDAGAPADAAWREAMETEISGYEASPDEYFRARAADLRDLQDRVEACLLGTSRAAIPPGSIVHADDLPPSQIITANWQGGAILLAHGSVTSHAAMLARARGIPMIVGLGQLLVRAGTPVLVDGKTGTVTIEPSEDDRRAFQERASAESVTRAALRRHLPGEARTRDGTRISLCINIADPAELDSVDPTHCDGIGLVRTELLFEGRALPDELTQFSVYRRIAEWARGKPVTIRTLDAGGDKPIVGVTVAGETNPFLGMRGVRLSLEQPALFSVQLRALARAAAHGTVEIMIPMVSIPSEMAQCRALLEAALATLVHDNISHGRPKLGMMVEVPAAALTPECFDADFLSIGSNDLTQYVMAAGRDNSAVRKLADPGQEAVLRLIQSVAAHGASAGRRVSLCGDAGGDPLLIPQLLRRGLLSLSVAPAQLAAAKAAIALIDLREGHA
jgi:phosphoenolpyruvate-protein phosphotransferase (PTS system enzyme I)